MIGVLLALVAALLPSLATYQLITRMWKTDQPLHWAARSAIAPGLGVGVASCLYFGFLYVSPSPRTAIFLDAGFWFVANVGLLLVTKSVGKSPGSGSDQLLRKRPAMWTPAVVATAAGFLILLGIAALSFWLRYTLRPDGEWDAFAIWNLRARAIARGAPDWAAVFSPELLWSSPHYPLLVPVSIARLWAYSGGESTLVPASIALLFFLSTTATLVVGVGLLVGWPAGFLSGAALLMSRTYVFQSTCQCGDVPLGFYALVTISFIAWSRHTTEPGPLLLTAGAAAGLAAWTKDEGIILLVLVVLAVGLQSSRLRKLACVFAGSALPILTLVFFKLQTESSSYLFSQDGGALEKVLDPSRWSRVAERLSVLGPAWGAVPGGALVCLGLAAAITARFDRRSASRAAFALSLVTAMLASYFFVYVITPLPLEWQINVTFDRLLAQFWPALVWAAFQFSDTRSETTLE